jgi:hypothetical protein
MVHMSDSGQWAARDWKEHGIRIVRANELDSNTPQTPGWNVNEVAGTGFGDKFKPVAPNGNGHVPGRYKGRSPVVV